MENELNEAEAALVNQWHDTGEVILVDVRETAEFEFEHIPGSFLMPLSFLDPDIFPKIEEKRIVLICAVGKRSLAAGKQLLKGGVANLVNLTGGLEAWKEAGFETEGARFEVTDFSI